MTTVAPYGSWTSPVTVESFTGRFVTLAQVRIDGPNTYWVEGHPKDGGRNVLLRRNAMGQTLEVLPMIDGLRLPDVRTRVHEYGGRAYAVHEGMIVFSDATDGRVYRYDVDDPTGVLRPLTPLDNKRYGDFEIDTTRDLVYAICEEHRDGEEPKNTMVSIPLNGSAARFPEGIEIVFAGTDFVSSPSLSPDGSKLAWLTWNHPHMPWTRSTLHVASVHFGGQIRSEIILIDHEDVCVYEPRWTLAGNLIHVDDSTGYANLYRTEGFDWREGEDEDAWVNRLRTRPLHPSQRVFSHPHWALGLHSYDNFDNEHLICSWAENQTWHIGTVRLDNGLIEEWPTGWWPVGNVAAADGRVVFLADSATHTPAIIEVHHGKTSIIRPSTESEIDPDFISAAQIISWPTRDGARAYGFFYPPTNPHFSAPDGELPPVLINVHGGPTTSARAGLKIPLQYWTSRGFAVLDVNYRGSTGLGRAYREALNGHWGVMDVNDCADGVAYLVEQELVDPQRVAIRGGSAGGFTTLAALATTDVFTAGVSHYGIADLRLLVEETHKFESHYMYRLIGTTDLSNPVWDERSPITHIKKVTAPLLLLQGMDDAVVPPSQARSMEQALSEAGGHVAAVYYEGEAHGFRKASSIHSAWRSELGFYGKVWGFSTDDGCEVAITNM